MGTSTLIELKLDALPVNKSIKQSILDLQISGFVLDSDYEIVPMESATGEKDSLTIIVHGWVDSSDVIKQLKEREEVVEVWSDTPIAPMEK